MKIKIFIVVIVVIVVYLLVSPIQTYDTLALTARAQTSLTSYKPDWDGAVPKSAVVFKTDEGYGYAAPGLTDHTWMPLIGNAYFSANDTHYAVPAGPSGGIHVYAKSGELLFYLEKGAYPVFRDGKIFALEDDNHRLYEYSSGGEALWHKDFSVPAAWLDAGGRTLVSGPLLGEVAVKMDDTWTRFPGIRPGDVICGLAYEPERNECALVVSNNGLEFRLYAKDSNENWYMHGSLPISRKISVPVDILFFAGNYILASNDLAAIGSDLRELQLPPIGGDVLSVAANNNKNLLAVLLKKQEGRYIHFYDEEMRLLVSAGLRDSPENLYYNQNDLMLVTRNKLLLLGGFE